MITINLHDGFQLAGVAFLIALLMFLALFAGSRRPLGLRDPIVGLTGLIFLLLDVTIAVGVVKIIIGLVR